MTTVALETLGCKLNQAESESLAGELLAAGYRLAADGENADICIVNTCTVTHIADRKARHLLRLARRNHPRALVVATGCYARRVPAELVQLGADLVVDSQEKPGLVDKLLGLCPPQAGQPGNGHWPRVRSLVKIQDGCDAFCTYCIVPAVRGREHSRPLQDILAEIGAKEAQGYREVVLTGTKVGRYRYGGLGLEGLLGQILSQSRMERIRLSSLQPQEITDDLISLWQNPRLCHHIHLPLQSGSDAVLRRMGRRYSAEEFKAAVSQLRSWIPGMAVTTDIIVGFPGETDAEFEATSDFCREMGFAAIHVFPFSARSGTPASEMSYQVEHSIKQRRVQLMLALSRESAQRFRQRLMERQLEVLWEREVSPGVWSGLTDSYLRVLTESQANLSNQLMAAVPYRQQGSELWVRLLG